MKYTDNRQIFNWNNCKTASIPYLSFRMLDELGVPNMYSTRYMRWDDFKGTGDKGLRLAYMKGEDVKEARMVIRNNLLILARQLGTDIDKLRITRQEHTDNVISIGEKDLGYEASINNTDPVDGIITNVRDACLVVYGADCPSIYIVDPVNKAIGLVHAGWKGTLGKISAKAIVMMQSAYGSNPADIYASVGPSICENCYEMGDEIYDLFVEHWGKSDTDELMKRHESGKYHLNLWKANRMILERAGIAANHIEVTNLCTCCNSDDFYSYRARKMENEQAAVLVNRFNK